jgi:predicted RNase H-like nuclease
LVTESPTCLSTANSNEAVAFVGFDSAWTDNPKALGAICAVVLADGLPPRFHAPQLVSFAGALRFVATIHATSTVTLIALDQPTVVVNQTSMRPVERVAASLISWLGGGVQPANRGRIGMFCDDSPIWGFLAALGATEDPLQARSARSGFYLMEVFPALALPSLDDAFFGRNAAPKYNPDRRKTFRRADWSRVAQVLGEHFAYFDLPALSEWCRSAATIEAPRKSDQDRLDSMICLLVALYWRLRPWQESIMLGSLETGYMVFPASAAVRERIAQRASLNSVPVA